MIERAWQLRRLMPGIVAGYAVIATSCVHSAEPAATVHLAAVHEGDNRAEEQFREGLRLAQANKLDEAASLFLRLTQDYPRLPEPYEQLAVVYQRQGNTQAAIGALRSAIRLRTDPVRLQERLGDLYLSLAAQSYKSAAESEYATDAVRQKYSELQALAAARLGR